MTWVDYKALKASMTMEQILDHYELTATLRRKGTNLIGTCPIHQGSNPNQFHVSTTKNTCNCFSDGHGGGNVSDFVVLVPGGAKTTATMGAKPPSRSRNGSD
jgi:DNA primase